MTQPGESTCEGRDRGDGHCLDCTLPMRNHPIKFVMPRDHPDPYIRKLGSMSDLDKGNSDV